MKGIEPLGRELCKIFRGQVHHKIIKMLKEISTWTRHASVHQHQFCPSVADSWCGWQPVQTGSDDGVCSPQHHAMHGPEAVFEVIKLTYVNTSAWWIIIRLCSSHAWEGWRKARMPEAFNAIMIWNMWPKQGFAGAEAVELSAHLAAARFNHGAVTRVHGCLTQNPDAQLGVLPILCATTQRCLKSQEGWSQGWWEAEIQEKSFEKVFQREGNVLRRKQRAKPMSLVPFDHDSCEWHGCFWSSNFVLFGGVRLTPCTVTF